MRPNRLCAALVLCLAAACLFAQFASAGVFCAQTRENVPPSIGFSAVPLKIAARESPRAERPVFTQAANMQPPPLPVSAASSVPLQGQAPPSAMPHIYSNGIHAPPYKIAPHNTK